MLPCTAVPASYNHVRKKRLRHAPHVVASHAALWACFVIRGPKGPEVDSQPRIRRILFQEIRQGPLTIRQHQEIVYAKECNPAMEVPKLGQARVVHVQKRVFCGLGQVGAVEEKI